MRIALLSWESLHSIAIGGVAAHVSELAEALARKGHDVHVFTRMAENQKTYDFVDGVHYHMCPFELNSHFITEIENMCGAFKDAVLATEDFGGPFDIVHAHDWLTAYAMLWVKDARHRKTIFTMHSTEYGRCGNNFAGGESEKVRHIEWLGTYHSDRVISVSNILKNELNWMYSLPSDKVQVIYNGINCHSFDGWIDALAVRRMYDIAPNDPLILYAGRMVYQKGPDVLMESIPHIVREFPNAKFVFVGDGGMKQEVEHMAHQFGVASSTRFVGHASGWRLIDLFKTADMVCVPSRNEPFGIVILEAWAAGKPVVASVNGGPSEFVWHDVNGIKVEARPDSLEWGVNTMLGDMDHALWMGRNGRLSAETMFSWDHIADETLATYNS